MLVEIPEELYRKLEAKAISQHSSIQLLVEKGIETVLSADLMDQGLSKNKSGSILPDNPLAVLDALEDQQKYGFFSRR